MQSLQRDDKSILDLVLEDTKSVRLKGSQHGRTKIDEYLESVRSVERRIEASLRPQKRWINEASSTLSGRARVFRKRTKSMCG